MFGANLGLLFVALAWGSIIPALNLLLPVWDPYFLSAGRYLVGAPIFLILLRLFEPGPLLPRGVAQWRLWVLGGVGIGAFAPLFTLGVAHAHPVMAAIVSACGPVVAALVARVFFATPLDRSILPAIALAVIGGGLATWNPGSLDGGFRLRGGEGLMLLATACWAWYSIAAKRWLRGLSQLRITGLTLAPGAVILAAIYLVFGAAGFADLPPAAPRDATDVALFAWIVLAAVVFGIFVWHFGVRHVGVVVASLYMNLVPIVAVAILAVLGTPPSWSQVCGGLLVVAGVIYVQLRQAQRRRRAANTP
jgi:drug/metabolite transporter (DMT)-like permease